MFTVVTTKQKHQRPSQSSSPNVKTVGDKSLDALVSDAWAELIPDRKVGPPGGPGWIRRCDFFAKHGMKDTTGRRWLSANRDRVEVCVRLIGNNLTTFIRPKRLAKIA